MSKYDIPQIREIIIQYMKAHQKLKPPEKIVERSKLIKYVRGKLNFKTSDAAIRKIIAEYFEVRLSSKDEGWARTEKQKDKILFRHGDNRNAKVELIIGNSRPGRRVHRLSEFTRQSIKTAK